MVFLSPCDVPFLMQEVEVTMEEETAPLPLRPHQGQSRER